MNKLIIKALFRVSIIVVSLVLMNFIYVRYFFESDLQKHSNVINQVRSVIDDESEIVYVGESSNITSRADDFDKRAISDFVSDYFPTIKMGDITKEASHAGIYYELLEEIPIESKVKTVVVTMNLRSFDATWIYSNLETQLQKSMVLLKNYPPIFNRFLLSFKAYDIKTEKEREQQFKKKWKNDKLTFSEPFQYSNVIDWDNGMAAKGIKNQDGSINNRLTELACNYIKTYAFQIDTLTNPRIEDFDKIVELSKQRKWNLVFNLLAENVEKADELVGSQLTYLIKSNRDLLVKRYNKNNVIVVDNLELVSDSEFIDTNWTTEHYAENGRKIIAKQVAEKLKKFYPNEFKEVNYDQTQKYDYFNDCEGKTIWGQMQTLSFEKSFSGKKSSKTGQKQDFSVTFEFPINRLPDSLKTMEVKFQLFQSEVNQNASIFIDISGEKTSNTKNQTPLFDLNKTLNKWSEVTYNFELPADFNQSDLIKVFIYNPTNSIIYVDDMSVKFKK